MKLGLFGYGKMGQAIEAAAAAQGLEIAWRLRSDTAAAATSDQLREADVAIEFTRPEAAFHNVMRCLEAGLPVVCGTTGWMNQLPQAQEYCRSTGGALLWASNFSVGVNLFFALNRYLAQLMNRQPAYEPSVAEVHHVHKLDAPSGTALSLTESLIAALDRKTGWVLHPHTGAPTDIPITAFREGEVPGTHIVRWNGPEDSITLEHTAHSRAGFAAGAVLAARWLPGRRGVFTMQDLLGIQ